MIVDWFHVAFAGIWPLMWEYGLGGFLIICCLAAAYFSPVFKKEFLYAAAVFAIVMVTFTVGVTTGEKRVQAQWDAASAVTLKQTINAHSEAVRSVNRKRPGWLPNRRDPDLRD